MIKRCKYDSHIINFAKEFKYTTKILTKYMVFQPPKKCIIDVIKVYTI